MLKIYIAGVLITLFWDIFWSLYRFLSVSSIQDRNMALLGLSRSIVTGRYQLGGHSKKEILWLILFIFLTSLLSWLGLVFELANSAQILFRTKGEPEELQKMRWRLKNVVLTKEEVALLDLQIAQIHRGTDFTSEQLAKIQEAYEKKGIHLDLQKSLKSQITS